MTAGLKTEYDITGLNYTLGELVGVLGVDAKAVVRAEAGQWAGQIADQLGPKNLSGAVKKVERDLKRNLSFKPVRENIKGTHQGGGEIKWLYAGNRFVAGIQRQDDITELSTMAAKQALRKSQGEPPRGKAWLDQGNRGNQNVVILNRLRVTKSTYNAIFSGLKTRLGELRATFAFTSAKLIGKRVPNFVSRHFPGMVRGKAIFDESKLNHPTNPSISFGSRAKGVISNAKIGGIIESSAKYRSKLISQKVKKILSGYAYDLKTGATFKPRAGQDYGSNSVMPS
jgi:hypothetical protein